MASFREQVQAIAHSAKSLDERIKELRALGLTKSDVEELLHQELYKKQNADEAARLKRRAENVNKRIEKSAKKTIISGKMKCLAIRQPWATLIAAGVKDVECRDNMVPPCKRFLVAASVTRAARTLDEVLDGKLLEEVNGYIQRGILPPYKEWPTGAIIGYVDIDKVTYEEVESPWGANHDGIKYILKNAHMLDAPILGKNKATPFFYNVEGYDEQHLPPAHVVEKK